MSILLMLSHYCRINGLKIAFSTLNVRKCITPVYVGNFVDFHAILALSINTLVPVNFYEVSAASFTFNAIVIFQVLDNSLAIGALILLAEMIFLHFLSSDPPLAYSQNDSLQMQAALYISNFALRMRHTLCLLLRY